MNLVQLYAQTPVERHHEIIVSGNRLFFDNEEHIIEGEESELRLVRSDKLQPSWTSPSNQSKDSHPNGRLIRKLVAITTATTVWLPSQAIPTPLIPIQGRSQ